MFNCLEEFKKELLMVGSHTSLCNRKEGMIHV